MHGTNTTMTDRFQIVNMQSRNDHKGLGQTRQFIVLTQPIVISLSNNGQPCCRSKINSTHSGKIENLFFYLEKLFFHVKPNMFIFEFHLCINHGNCHGTKLQRFLEK